MTNDNLSVDLITNAVKECDGDLQETAKKLGVKYITLYYWISRYKIPFDNKKHISVPVEQLWEAYKECNSLQEVANKFGLKNKEGLRQLLKRNGYTINKPIHYDFNSDFFKNDNEKSFYWAGFIAADGCVKEIKRKSCNNINYEFSLGLSKTDKDHLEKFKKDIGYDGPIHDYLIKNSIRNSKWNDTYSSQISMTSKVYFDDLKKFNIVPMKSLIYTFPEWLIDHELINHFMRGYFDGDGSWYIGSSKKTDQIFFSLRGTVEFLGIYRSVLESKCNLEERLKDIRINSGIGVLEYGGNGIVKKICKFLYKDANVSLSRKYDIIRHLNESVA
jgi:transposase